MAFAIAMYVRDTALKLRNQGLELDKRALGMMGSSTGYDGVYSPTPTGTHDSWKMDLGDEQEDLTWLI